MSERNESKQKIDTDELKDISGGINNPGALQNCKILNTVADKDNISNEKDVSENCYRYCRRQSKSDLDFDY